MIDSLSTGPEMNLILEKLRALIKEEFAHAQVEMYKARGLVSFYAEKGGILLGFEKQFA